MYRFKTETDQPVKQQKKNTTGLPDHVKSGVEQLSGMNLDQVQVHYNSSHPAQLNAHAYAQGNQIHVAPGQEHHIAHETWHMVQQAQGRVPPTTQVGGQAVNDNPALEAEADQMGRQAERLGKSDNGKTESPTNHAPKQLCPIIQLSKDWKTSALQQEIKKEQQQVTDFDLVHTAHHILPKSELWKTYQQLSGHEQKNIAQQMAGKDTLTEKKVKSLQFNLTLGPKPELRTDDPKNGFDPNYASGVMTPRSKALSKAWNASSNQIDPKALADALQKAKQMHQHHPIMNRSKWNKKPNGKFSRDKNQHAPVALTNQVAAASAPAPQNPQPPQPVATVAQPWLTPLIKK
ncbi:eCIS core domain-containing protein, partial [Vibrio quintilis]